MIYQRIDDNEHEIRRCSSTTREREREKDLRKKDKRRKKKFQEIIMSFYRYFSLR